MQIKQRGSVFQLIRYAGYSQEKKRATTQLVGSFPSYATRLDEVDAEVLSKLTPEENEQLSEFLDNALSRRTKYVSDSALQSLPTTIEQCKLALEAGTQITDPDKIFVALRDLAQAMVKAGYKRPKLTDKKPAEQNDPRQITID